MEWLKPILEKAKIEDNKISLEPVMEEIKTAMKDHVIDIKEYNNINTQLDNANTARENLKSKNKDNTDLQDTITKHENDMQTLKDTHKKELESLHKTNAINTLLSNNKAKYPDLLKDKFDLDKIIISDDGSTSGLTEQFESIKTNYTDMFHTDENLGSDDTYIYNPESGNKQKNDTGATGFVGIIQANQARK